MNRIRKRESAVVKLNKSKSNEIKREPEIPRPSRGPDRPSDPKSLKARERKCPMPNNSTKTSTTRRGEKRRLRMMKNSKQMSPTRTRWRQEVTNKIKRQVKGHTAVEAGQNVMRDSLDYGTLS